MASKPESENKYLHPADPDHPRLTLEELANKAQLLGGVIIDDSEKTPPDGTFESPFTTRARENKLSVTPPVGKENPPTRSN